MPNDIKNKIKSLYEIMKDSNVKELKVNSKDYSVSLKRKDLSKTKNQVATQKQQNVVQALSSENNQKESTALRITIKSPLTGIFYKTPSPSSPAFVNEGDIVEVGDIICIIEAMKVMNEIKSASKVKILKILIENGKTVNSGQDLFEVEKA
jgi:acetyl-CoA carboxylase biotin carboxyl carrier protein